MICWLPIHQVPAGQPADQLLSIGWHTCTEIPLQIQSRRPKKAQGTRWALLKISQWQDAPQVQDGKLIERKNNEKTRQNAASPPVSKFVSKGYTEKPMFPRITFFDHQVTPKKSSTSFWAQGVGVAQKSTILKLLVVIWLVNIK